MEVTEFHPEDCSSVLDMVLRKIEAAPADRPRLLVLDLDSTLYEVGPRTLAIIAEWLAAHPNVPSEVRQGLAQLERGNMGYSIQDCFRIVALDPDSEPLKDLVLHLRDFWWARFFTSSYLEHDKPYSGTVDFVKRAHTLGAEICYLTGREEKTMRPGTEKNLLRDGFPWGDARTHLLMRKPPHKTDVEHKEAAAHWLNARGNVIASFENEPANLVRLSQLMPGAMHIYCETVCSESPAPQSRGLFRIKGFHSQLKK